MIELGFLADALLVILGIFLASSFVTYIWIRIYVEFKIRTKQITASSQAGNVAHDLLSIPLFFIVSFPVRFVLDSIGTFFGHF